MEESNIRLIYPPTLVNLPVIYQLIRKYDLAVNILRAHITPEHGWIEVQLSGDSPVIAEALTWLRDLGIDVRPISQ